jgi:hypothetical protein
MTKCIENCLKYRARDHVVAIGIFNLPARISVAQFTKIREFSNIALPAERLNGAARNASYLLQHIVEACHANIVSTREYSG